MKLRSASELTDHIDKDLAWRKRELTTAKLLVDRARSHEQSFLIRAGICLLYAHWEGFVNLSSTAYLNYISRQGLKLKNLQPPLIALALLGEFTVCANSAKITLRTALTDLLLSDLEKVADIPWEDAVSAHGNLKCEVLREITLLLGLNYSPYAVKELMIDGKLIYYRNGIAHGSDVVVSPSEYNDLHEGVIWLVERFRDDVQNAVAVRAYLR